MSLLGLDVGTTGCKAVAFRADGHVLAEARRQYPLANPQPGFWELDAERVWNDVAACIGLVAAETSADPIAALAISALGEAVLPVGDDLRPLARAPISADLRAIRQAEALKEKLGADAIHQITGQPPSPLYSLTKIMWWKANEPQLSRRTRKFLCFGDFILTRLGLEPVIDYSMAARTLAFDVHRLTWSDAMLEAAEVPVEKFPRLMQSGAILGEIGGSVAADLGLPPGTKVVIGGFDQACGALGAGVIETGAGFYGLGTTEALAVVMAPPYPDLKRINVALCPHVAPGRALAMAGSQTGGRLLRWYRQEFGAVEEQIAREKKRDVYDVILDGLSPAPSPLMVLPHFAGSGSIHSDPLSRGAILGLTFDSTKHDVVKAILEGVTYEQALCLSLLNELGVPLKELTVVGGGASSPTLLQLKADIIGQPLHGNSGTDASSLGAGLLAGCAIGTYAGIEDACAQTAGPAKTFVPDPARHAIYRERLQVYAGLYEALSGIARSLRG